MKIKLVDTVISGLAGKRKAYLLPKDNGEVTLGRGREVDITVPNIGYLNSIGEDPEKKAIISSASGRISKQHCTITYEGSDFKIYDGVGNEKSRCGTFVNKTPVDGETQLTNRDKINLDGKYILEVLVVEDEPANLKVVEE